MPGGGGGVVNRSMSDEGRILSGASECQFWTTSQFLVCSHSFSSFASLRTPWLACAHVQLAIRSRN